MGWFHTSRYLQLPNAQIAAIADIVPERLEAKEAVEINISAGEGTHDLSQAARYGEGLDLIREADVDVVDICLPTYLHAEYAIAAMEAGRHVLCEKPMALNAADADRMVAAAQRHDRLLMVAQVVRFWPEYVYLARLIEDQAFGKLQSLNMWRLGGRPGWSPDNWFLDPALSGGVILDLHVHDIDYVSATLGKPDKLFATGRQSAGAKTYDIIHAIFEYQDGPQVHMHAGWASAQIHFKAGFEAWFDHAFVQYRDGELSVIPESEGAAKAVPECLPGDGYRNEIAYFLHCVETRTAPTQCLPTSTRDSLALIESELAAIQS
jgi:predicted dehydrogenase